MNKTSTLAPCSGAAGGGLTANSTMPARSGLEVIRHGGGDRSKCLATSRMRLNRVVLPLTQLKKSSQLQLAFLYVLYIMLLFKQLIPIFNCS
jgi:hypothetical protein